MWNLPYGSVVASRPCGVTTRTPGQAFFAVVLHSVAIDVVEDLAKHVCAIEGSAPGTTRTLAVASPDRGLPVTPVYDLRAVDELAFANTSADGEQQDDLASGAAEAEAIPRELEAGHGGSAA